MSTDVLTPADIAAVTGNNDGFGGGNGAWWIIILFLFAFMGYGNGFGGNNSGATDNYVLASDFATLQRQIDAAADRLNSQNVSISNGLCDGFYQEAQLMNGLNNSLNTQAYETRNAIAGVQSQLQQCCCDNRAAIADVNYNMATNANAITNAVNSGFCQSNYNAATNTRDIVEAQNANTQSILAAIQQMQISAKDDKIASLTATVNELQTQATQNAQTAILLNAINPPVNPAYVVPNPNAAIYTGCNCNLT